MRTVRRPRRITLARAARLALLAIAALVGAVSAGGVAQATPRALPFTYPYHTLSAGSAELEQHVDIIPTRVSHERADGDLEGVMSQRYQLQTEFEYGITDRLEAAFYVVMRQSAAEDAPLRLHGLKQRLRYLLVDEVDAPVGVGLYFEVAEMQDEIELEQKIILGRRFGALQVLANLWFEQEWYFREKQKKLIYNPTIGASWEFSPRLMIGLEYWARGRLAGTESAATDGDSPARVHHFLGPTVLLQGKSMWFSLGVYAGLASLRRGFEVNEAYGPLWTRVMVGVDL